MVKVDGVGLEDIVAIRCSGIHDLAKFAGIERGVVKVADDGEGNDICGWWQEAAAPTHWVLSEGYMCVEAKVEAKALVSATRSRAATPASEAWGVCVGAVVICSTLFLGSCMLFKVI